MWRAVLFSLSQEFSAVYSLYPAALTLPDPSPRLSIEVSVLTWPFPCRIRRFPHALACSVGNPCSRTLLAALIAARTFRKFNCLPANAPEAATKFAVGCCTCCLRVSFNILPPGIAASLCRSRSLLWSQPISLRLYFSVAWACLSTVSTCVPSRSFRITGGSFWVLSSASL
jgi:hypothetical protein